MDLEFPFSRKEREEGGATGVVFGLDSQNPHFWQNRPVVGHPENRLMDAYFDPGRMPVGAVDFLERQKNDGPIFSPDYWGGYLIYRLNRGVGSAPRVVVDDRHDLYGEVFLKSYLETIHVEHDWPKFMDQYKPECVLLPNNSPLAAMMRQSLRWKAVYVDGVATAFVRDSD